MIIFFYALNDSVDMWWLALALFLICVIEVSIDAFGGDHM
jgi:hypothetical protein